MKTNKLLSFLKEPIVQFTILGALLFGVDHILMLNRDDPRNVLVDDNQIQQFIAIFEEGQARSPSGREINNMVIAWAQNEILYREARRMGLDRGDDMIRTRLLLKIHNVIFNNVVIDHPGEEQLQQFFEFNRAAYHIPERYDVEMIVLPGHVSLAEARELQNQAPSAALPSGNRYHYQNRSKDNLTAMFGTQDSATILAAGSGNNEWSLVSNERGHHLVRLTATHEAVVPALASVRSRVIQDWERYAGDMQIAEQTHSIARQYQVRLDVSDSYLEIMANNLPRNPFLEAGAVSQKPADEQAIRSALTVDRR